MPFKFNPITAQLDLVNSGGSGSGVTGVPPSEDKAIPRWVGTAADTIDSSLSYIQDGGAIESQGFITRRSVTATVVIPDGESWIAPALELELTGSIELEPNGELIIV
jgi:hypothetical protein